ncbi:hypothetical protein [Urechidicola vernalis]|uniref:Lipoprotein n=1 Tax=Urechidicola vernalis TaxID=3075600 RepID=A0ABU2Y9V5_9FLAO|nr:hypothetical protein [Urechidicola sp. P050]MDT0554035.1 hypothetical protein [Urechidicola sp. P050]
MIRKLYFSLILLCLYSCSEKTDRIQFTVENFSKGRIDTQKPYPNKSYTKALIRVKGFCNDSIIIKEQGDTYNFKFSGNIDTILQMEYYGTYNKIFLFNPYRCTNGKLLIEYDL